MDPLLTLLRSSPRFAPPGPARSSAAAESFLGRANERAGRERWNRAQRAATSATEPFDPSLPPHRHSFAFFNCPFFVIALGFFCLFCCCCCF